MKIALLVPGFSSHERDWCIPVLLDYVRALSAADTVHVFTLRWPEQQARYRVFGADVVALGGRRHMGGRVAALWLRALRALAAEHQRAPFDVIHAFWADEPGWVAALAGAWLRRPVVLSLAGGELVALPDIGYGFQTLPGRRSLVGWLMQRAAVVTAGSHYLLGLAQAQVRGLTADSLRRLPLGVDLDRFQSAQASLDGATRIGLNVGALYPVKDQALLLRAARHLPEVEVRLVGHGPLLPTLQALAAQLGLSERVRILGPLDHTALPAIYASADVFVQTSRHEAQGMALLEAAACGVPVVGTPVGVLPEVGLAARDEAALVQTLGGLLGDEPRRRSTGEAAREQVRAEYGLDLALRRFRELYANVLG